MYEIEFHQLIDFLFQKFEGTNEYKSRRTPQVTIICCGW